MADPTNRVEEAVEAMYERLKRSPDADHYTELELRRIARAYVELVARHLQQGRAGEVAEELRRAAALNREAADPEYASWLDSLADKLTEQEPSRDG